MLLDFVPIFLVISFLILIHKGSVPCNLWILLSSPCAVSSTRWFSPRTAFLACFLVTACVLTSSKRWPASLSSALGVAHSTWTVAMGVRRPTASRSESTETHWPSESTEGLGALTLRVALDPTQLSAGIGAASQLDVCAAS